jgi:hypothetical protein
VVAVSDPYADNSPQSTNVTYTVTAPDTGAPVVTITSPANGSSIPSRGNVNVNVTASDSSGIATIQLIIDNQTVKTCTNVNTCAYKWSTGKVTAGAHTIRAIAKDKSSPANQSEATVTVMK